VRAYTTSGAAALVTAWHSVAAIVAVLTAIAMLTAETADGLARHSAADAISVTFTADEMM